MSQPISKTNEEPPILGICIAVLAIAVLMLSWRVSAYIDLQNDNIKSNVLNMEQQSARGQQMDANSFRLVQTFVGYIQQTRDSNNISRLLGPYMPFLPVFGIQVQQGPPPTGSAPPAAQPAPAAAAPAAPPAR